MFKKDFLYDIERKDEELDDCWHSISKFIEINVVSDWKFTDVHVILGDYNDDIDWILSKDYSEKPSIGTEFIVTELGHYLEFPEYYL